MINWRWKFVRIRILGSKDKKRWNIRWGFKYGFIEGGFLGAKSKKRKAAPEEAPKDRKKIGFLEQDQENLNRLVQDAATMGRQGLCIRDGSIKVAGVRFEGKKTSFDDNEDEDSVDTDSQEEAEVDEENDDDEIPEVDVKEPKLKLKNVV